MTSGKSRFSSIYFNGLPQMLTKAILVKVREKYQTIMGVISIEKKI